MQSFWDMLPASLWPTQSFISPAEQARALVALQSRSAPSDPWSVPRLDSAASTWALDPPQAGSAMSAAGYNFFPPDPNPTFRPTWNQPLGSNNPAENATRAWKTLGLLGGWEPLPD